VQVQNDKHHVVVKWADGRESKLPIGRLRGYCPCAECQGHKAQIKWIDNRTIHISAASMVGRYAINFHFADGHKTGIFRWEALRKLDPGEESRWGTPEISLLASNALS
jgi:DUF971 family protein